MNIKFVYDEKNIQDIKVLFLEGDSDFRDTFKIFCIDSLSPDLEPTITETDDGYLVETNNGTEALGSMMRFLYLTMKLAEVYGPELKSGNFDPEKFSLEKLQPEIDKVKDLSHSEIAELMGADIEHDDNV